MNQAQYDKQTLDAAWQEVEYTFQQSGMAAPMPGFTDRFAQRLAADKRKEERKQAWILVVTNIVIALGFVGLMSVKFIPDVPSDKGLLSMWVEIITQVVVSLKMFGGLVTTLARTLPALVPTSWWVGGFTILGLVVVVWASMVRQHIYKQGAQHEQV